MNKSATWVADELRERGGEKRRVKPLGLSLSEMGNAGRVRNISDEVFPGILVGDK